MPAQRIMVPLMAKEADRQSQQEAEAWLESAFQEHWRRVFAVVYRLVGDAAEAEDLALEAFWRLYGQRSQLKGEAGAWLYRVATNLGFNALRARRRRARYEIDAGMHALETDPVGDPAGELENKQERRRVRLALSRMKTRSTEILILRYSGLSYAEIASTLQIAPGSVGTLLARAEAEFEACYQLIQGESHAP
jgi:RNA polymerase sigma-70 factor (ECF subfamily)